MSNPRLRRAILTLLVVTFASLTVGGAIQAGEPGWEPEPEATASTPSVDPAPPADSAACGNATLNAAAKTERAEANQYAAIEPPAETVDDGPLCHGILTCTFYVTGQVVRIPFRVLGGVLEIVI